MRKRVAVGGLGKANWGAFEGIQGKPVRPGVIAGNFKSPLYHSS